MKTKRIVAVVLVIGSATFAAADDPKPAQVLPGTQLVEPKIPETVTGRLRSFNEELSRGVRPEENAAVHLLQLFSANTLPAGLRDDSLAMLGVESLSPDAPRLIGLEEFARSSTDDPELGGEQFVKLNRELAESLERPWKADQFPAAAAWLDANRPSLDLIKQAASLEKYYFPILSEEVPPRITAAAFDFELKLKGIAPFLLSRAMRSAGEGDIGAALDDLLALRRLGRLLATGSPLDVSHAKAHVIDGFACRGLRAMIEHRSLPAEKARELLRQRSMFEPFPPAAEAADRGERAALEVELGILSREETLVRDYLEIHAGWTLPNLEQTRLKDLDWTQASRRALELQDRIVAALRIDSHKEQAERFAALNKDFDAWQKRSDELYRPGEGVVDMDFEAMSRWVGETVAMSMRPNAWQRRASDDRGRLRIDLVKIGVALVVAAGERGSYPDSLDELRPEYLDAIPVDAHSGKPLTYRRREDGSAVLVSFGQNGMDDANQIYNDDTILILPAPPGR